MIKLIEDWLLSLDVQEADTVNVEFDTNPQLSWEVAELLCEKGALKGHPDYKMKEFTQYPPEACFYNPNDI